MQYPKPILELINSYMKLPGIGKKTAELIVDTLGVDCLEKIYEDIKPGFSLNC